MLKFEVDKVELASNSLVFPWRVCGKLDPAGALADGFLWSVSIER